MAARSRGRLPQLRHRQGRRRPRPHLADRRPRHVRRGFSVQGLGAGRELRAWAISRSRCARPEPIPNGSRPAPEPRWPISQQQYSAPRTPEPARRADVDRSAGRRAAGVSAAADARCTAIQSAGAAGLAAQRPVSRLTTKATSRRFAAARRRPSKRMTRKNCRPTRGRAQRRCGPPQSGAAFAAAWPAAHPQPVAATPIEIKPTATLACPIVSALDRWFANAVQPAAHKWFNQPVVEIKQISAYSCRGMNGQVGAQISEHAFGNALDIAAFVLADGHRITVKGGWQGSPEEQGFLRDVQGVGLRPVHHGAGAGLQPIPLRSHPRRPDAAGERPAHLQSGRGGRRSGGVARPQEPALRLVAADRAAADAALRPAG